MSKRTVGMNIHDLSHFKHKMLPKIMDRQAIQRLNYKEVKQLHQSFIEKVGDKPRSLRTKDLHSILQDIDRERGDQFTEREAEDLQEELRHGASDESDRDDLKMRRVKDY